MKTKTNDPTVGRTRVVDMSPEAIARRLARLEQLFRLGISLRKARRIGKPTPR
jgi:hypothetical protein